jgi:23S rRNA (cytidine2498-2'-O)-methyltransferase
MRLTFVCELYGSATSWIVGCHTGEMSLATTTAYLGAEGYVDELLAELAHYKVKVTSQLGNLVISSGEAIDATWSQNTWFECERIPITSIGDGARELRARQRNWALLQPEVASGRAGLIAEKLPFVSAKPLAFGQVAPTAPLGSWTLLSPVMMLAAAKCSSPFPNGVATFVEDRGGPPSRAYLKLWEACAILGRWPTAEERCVDLGACPGGWTWSMARCGATVVAVDKSPLDDDVAAMPNVTFRGESAFGIDPASTAPGSIGEHGRFDWMCSDIAAYPDRLLRLAQSWAPHVSTMVLTIKLQGATDYALLEQFRALMNSRVLHLSANKHELTLLVDRKVESDVG